MVRTHVSSYMYIIQIHSSQVLRTINGESFTGLAIDFCSFCGFLKHKSFFKKSFNLNINAYIISALALYCESITKKIH